MKDIKKIYIAVQQSHSAARLGICVGFLVFANNADIPSISSLDLCSQQRQSLPHVNHLTYQSSLEISRNRTQVRHSEIATHSTQREMAGLGDTQ